MRATFSFIFMFAVLAPVGASGQVGRTGTAVPITWDSTACWRLTVGDSDEITGFVVGPFRSGGLVELSHGGPIGFGEIDDKSRGDGTYTWITPGPDTLQIIRDDRSGLLRTVLTYRGDRFVGSEVSERHTEVGPFRWRVDTLAVRNARADRHACPPAWVPDPDSTRWRSMLLDLAAEEIRSKGNARDLVIEGAVLLGGSGWLSAFAADLETRPGVRRLGGQGGTGCSIKVELYGPESFEDTKLTPGTAGVVQMTMSITSRDAATGDVSWKVLKLQVLAIGGRWFSRAEERARSDGVCPMETP